MSGRRGQATKWKTSIGRLEAQDGIPQSEAFCKCCVVRCTVSRPGHECSVLPVHVRTEASLCTWMEVFFCFGTAVTNLDIYSE